MPDNFLSNLRLEGFFISVVISDLELARKRFNYTE